MGGGLAGWFTPGWMVHEPRLAPHLNKKPEYIDAMLKAGEDPKPLVLEDCKPQCTFWKEKLERCEQQLEVIVKVNVVCQLDNFTNRVNMELSRFSVNLKLKY